MAAAAGGAAAVARRKRIQSSSAFGVVKVESSEFLRAIALEPEPLIVRAPCKGFWGNKLDGQWRYLAAVKGLVFLRDKGEDLRLPDEAIIIDCEQIKVPADV